jgi:hypothetical protein
MTNLATSSASRQNPQSDIDLLRIDLSACYRMATRLGMHEGI